MVAAAEPVTGLPSRPSHTDPPGVRGAGRLAGLDGIRGLAALFVVLHHCWLLSFPGYPANTGPAWTGWLVFGHLAVVVFIVLSGFSLAVSPARSDWRLGGVRRFAQRRAWRILPPYWAALAFSMLVAITLVSQPGQGAPTAKSALVYGLLAQDIVGAPSPNGAFWSIAIEAQLYLVFPLLLVILRAWGAAVMLGLVTVTVVVVGVLAPHSEFVGLFLRLTPQFAALFAVGALAAGILNGRAARWRRLPLASLSALTALPVFVLIVHNGPEWTVGHYFWVDLAFGPSMGFLLAAISVGRPAPLVRFLDTAPLRRLGSFSYSLYLTHAPVVVVLHALVVRPAAGHGVDAFLMLMALAVPASLLLAWLFASVFELPFQRHRDPRALWTAIRARMRPGETRPAVAEASAGGRAER